mgnify:CR=1 FL=1
MYLDTSVVVKLYTHEADSAACEKIVVGHKIVSSELLYAELWSALLAKERSGALAPGQRLVVWTLFESHLIDDVVELLAQKIDLIERRIREEVPEAKHLDLEAEL